MIKLSNADKNRILSRSLFVDASKSVKDIAGILVVGEKTISNYQTKDKKEGFDWLTLRASKHIQTSSKQKENMYSTFVGYMHDTIREIRESDKLSTQQKADKLVSLGDSFSKMGKVARNEDPEAYKLGIVKHTVTTILEALKEIVAKECMEQIIETIYKIQDELSDINV